MTFPAHHDPAHLDFDAAARWPVRAAAHLLGAGLVAAVIVALPVAPTDLDRHQLPKETIVHLITWLAVLLARPRMPRAMRPAIRWSLLLLIAVAIASSLVATNGWLAFRATALMVTAAAAFTTATYVASLGAGAVLLTWCGIAGVVGAGTGLAQAYGLDSPLFASTRLPGGTFGNRNFMAHFAALTMPVVLMTVLAARRRLVAALGLVAVVFLVAAIILSRSRAAWIGAGIGAAMMALACILARRRNAVPSFGPRPALLVAAVLAAIIGAVVIPNRLAWKSGSPYSDTLVGLANHDEGSGRGRVLQYRNTIRLALQHPVLGVGPGNWSIHYADVAPASDPTWVFGDVVPINPWPSSDWMALLSEVGPAAVLLALLFGGAVGWRAIRGWRSSGARVLAGSALLGLLATTLLTGSFDAVLLLPAPLLLVAIASGALLVRTDDPAADAEAARAAPSRWLLLLPLALALCTLRSALQTAAYVVAGSGRSVTRLAWAVRIDPGSYPLRIALAQRLPCNAARTSIAAALDLAPTWPAPIAAARRCGVRVPR
ncbi:MAG TPA: O-antigen ligase family protein [Gemmatimonadales bacterium]